MPLISLKEVSLQFGGPSLLNAVDLHINEGDRLCLLGRNGTGKSSLLRLIAGRVDHFDGTLTVSRGTRLAYLEQEAVAEFTGSALDYASGTSMSDIEAEKVLTKLGVEPSSVFSTLSGGGKRRVMLAAAIASDTEVLLLDEPTNHLDISATLWLEAHLLRSVKTFVLVTHDRAFAKAVSNRTAELDRGRLTVLDCGVDEFLRRGSERAEAETRRQEVFDKRLSEEEAWLRRGTKARRTRDEGRVRALLGMREEYAERRSVEGSMRLRVQDAGRSGSLVAEAVDVHFSYGIPGSSESSPPIIRNLTTTIMRGDRIGIVGANGVGKTTLVRLLLGELEPQQGSIRRGTRLSAIYLDQIRDALREEQTIADFLADGGDTVMIAGRPKHLRAYLQDFLFEPDRARSPVSVLSGGEKNRLMLAKLFLQPSNLLVMDEPTNDLDLDTLSLLEQMLVEYAGTIILVTHDRELLDNVVTHCLVFLPDGSIEELAGGYADWGQRLVNGPPSRPARSGTRNDHPRREKKPVNRSGPRKLSFAEARELDSLPEAIADHESKIEAIHETLADPELYKNEPNRISTLRAELEERERARAAAYERWEELDQVASES